MAVRERAVIAALLVLILGGSLFLSLSRLADPELTIWDESFHAIVARNLLKHPLEPTLIDRPYVPYDYRNWHENHVWMHKPILPLWQIAASFAVLGVDRFALRLPSAILATASVLLTYLIGRRLVDRRAAIVAAAIQGASPAIVQLVHGRLFADHVDVSLLFWTELSILFLLRAVESGRWRDVVVCGVAQGCAYLSKSYLAAIVTGLSVVALMLGRFARPGETRSAPNPDASSAPRRGPLGGLRPASPFALRHVLGTLAAALLTVAPWTIYSFLTYRNEFLFEYAAWWHHLAGEWEDWGAPWQRVVFDYLPNLHQFLYGCLALGAAGLVIPAIRERSFGLLFALAWVAGVFIPHFVAPTKTPTATLIAIPAFAILFGALVRRAVWGRDSWSQALWTAVAIAGIAAPAVIRPPNRGYALEPGIASIAGKHPWVMKEAAIALAAFLVLLALLRVLKRPRALRALRTGLVFVAAAGSLWLFARNGRAALRSLSPPETVDYSEVGAYARARLPSNAVLLVAGKNPYEHQLAMFHADRTAYGARAGDLPGLVAAVRAAGGDPYLVTPPGAGYPVAGLPVFWQSEAGRPAIYRLP